jgi:hypothetical protein
MTTALDIINSALRVLQVAASDVTLTANEANSGLDALNVMIDSWSLENLMLYHMVTETFSLTAGKNPHTFGTGGDFNSTRPLSLTQATVSVGGVDQQLQIVGFDDYSALKLKNLQSPYPQYLNLDMDYPLAKVELWPVPSQTTTVTLYTQKPLTDFSNLTSTFVLPPGYTRALKFGLAIELASEYQTTAGVDVITLFRTAKSNIKRINARPQTMTLDPALLKSTDNNGSYNIYSGQ